MENLETRTLVVLAVVLLVALGAAWTQFLEHQRRMKTLDVIKAALEQGREPPAMLFRDLRKPDSRLKRWGEAGVFGALGFGFSLAFFFAEPDDRFAFGVIAATMTVTAIGCAIIALVSPRPPRDGASADDEPR